MSRPRTLIISKARLEDLYLRKRLSLDEILQEFNCSQRTIFNRFHEYKIPIRYAGRRTDIVGNDLKNLYFIERRSIGEIAKIYNCSAGTIWSKFSQYNITPRTKRQAHIGKYRIEVPEQRIKSFYYEEKLSIEDISKIFACSSNTILRRLHAYNLKIRLEKIDIPREALKKLYVNNRMTIYQIAERFSCNEVTILNRLNEYGIPIRKKGESNLGKYIVNIPIEKTRELYVDRKIPISIIKKMFKCHAMTLHKRLQRYGVEIRDISEALKGKPSPMLGKHHTEETRKKLSILTTIQLASGKMKRKNTSIELKIEEELKRNFIDYQKNIALCGVTVPDFYLPNHKLAIYADGDYWHNLEVVRIRDEKQNKILKENGYGILRFWEHEIDESPESCIGRIKTLIKT